MLFDKLANKRDCTVTVSTHDINKATHDDYDLFIEECVRRNIILRVVREGKLCSILEKRST